MDYICIEGALVNYSTKYLRHEINLAFVCMTVAIGAAAL